MIVKLFQPAFDANDMFGSKRIAVGYFGIRSFTLVFSQLYEVKPDPGLLGEYNWLTKNGPRQEVRIAKEEAVAIIYNL